MVVFEAIIEFKIKTLSRLSEESRKHWLMWNLIPRKFFFFLCNETKIHNVTDTKFNVGIVLKTNLIVKDLTEKLRFNSLILFLALK